MIEMETYLNHGPPFISDVSGQFETSLTSYLMAFVHNFNENETDAANDAGRHKDEHAGHVLQTECRRRLLVVLALLLVAAFNPFLVQIFHESSCFSPQTVYERLLACVITIGLQYSVFHQHQVFLFINSNIYVQ